MLKRHFGKLVINDCFATPTGRTELTNALTAWCWGIILLNPFAETFRSAKFLAPLSESEIISENILGVTFCVFGIIGLWSALLGNIRFRLIASELYALLWSVCLVIFAYGDFWGNPSALIYFVNFVMTFSVSTRLRRLKRAMQKSG